MTRARSWLRLCLVAGGMSYRAQFSWLSPWVFVPTLIVAPLMQVLLFVYIGRSAGVADDRYFLIGNSVQLCSVACLFAIVKAIDGERSGQTLGSVMSTPAPRAALFLGRALPAVLTGLFVSVVTFTVGSMLLRVSFSPEAYLMIVVAMAVASVSCTGLGMCLSAVALVTREGSALANIAVACLLLLSGANVAHDQLPGPLRDIGPQVPLARAISAARLLAVEPSDPAARGLLVGEFAFGLLGLALGLMLLHLFEVASRRRGGVDFS